MAKGTIYPKDFYVIVDDKGSIRFYDQDPFHLENAEDKDIDFGQKLFAEYGEGDIRNPLIIRVLGAVVHRCEKFDAMKLGKILARKIPMHVEDAEGTLVQAVQQKEGSDYPIVGTLLSPEGDVLDHRRYTNEGDCEDGLRSHRLVLVKDIERSEEEQVRQENARGTGKGVR